MRIILWFNIEGGAIRRGQTILTYPQSRNSHNPRSYTHSLTHSPSLVHPDQPDSRYILPYMLTSPHLAHTVAHPALLAGPTHPPLSSPTHPTKLPLPHPHNLHLHNRPLLLPGGSPPKLIHLSMKAASTRVPPGYELNHCNVAEGIKRRQRELRSQQGRFSTSWVHLGPQRPSL